jgi:hypothetical protein
MPRLALAVFGACLAAATLAARTACGTRSPSPADRAASATPSASLSPARDAQAMLTAVHADATQIIADIQSAETSNPGLGASSNPYDYAAAVSHSPAYLRLVARGPAALDAIATQITARPNDLDAYVLAIVGQTIQARAKQSMGPKTWDTGWGWASQYLSWAKDHPASN